MAVRCINYDWVEVFCVESCLHPLTREHWLQTGYSPKDLMYREYGTPQYNEVITLCAEGKKMIEVRRDPKSCHSKGGILPDRACHIRLTNRSCYLPDPVGYLISFLEKHHIQYVSTKRMDICLDFNHFDRGDDPARFLMKYAQNKYAKMHQTRLHPHGNDEWQCKRYNSIKWGSDMSQINTKLYDKTLELEQKTDKPWIRDAWKAAGLDTRKHVWRVEFSINSDLKNLVREDDGSLLNIEIMQFRTREQVLNLFFMLADRYFDFRYVEKTGTGRFKRKDRCTKKVLFDVPRDCECYKPVKLDEREPSSRPLEQFVKRLKEIAMDESNPQRIRLDALDLIDHVALPTRIGEKLWFQQMRDEIKMSIKII